MYMYIHVCMYIHICIYVYACMYVYTYTYIYTLNLHNVISILSQYCWEKISPVNVNILLSKINWTFL